MQAQEKVRLDQLQFHHPRPPVLPVDEVHARVQQLRRIRYGGQGALGDREFGRGRRPGLQARVGDLGRVEGRPGSEDRPLALACSSRPPKNCSARSPPASMPRMYG
ncbi:hypothetical protein QF027_003173 [Streptomyces canus]|nr:hypothetical protein [Streptomyces canus]